MKTVIQLELVGSVAFILIVFTAFCGYFVSSRRSSRMESRGKELESTYFKVNFGE